MGHSHCSGRVELLHKENRHTVCDAAFDWQDAEVVCRELDSPRSAPRPWCPQEGKTETVEYHRHNSDRKTHASG